MLTPKQNAAYGTFSILAISSDMKFLGVAVASGSTFVGHRVPHAKPHVGVIATQAYTNVAYGKRGLKLLAMDLSPKEALERLLAEDAGREFRQVAIMDFKKQKAVYTGASVPACSAEIVGSDYVVVGNMLSAFYVANKIADQFENSCGSLALRLVLALKAGSESGGDKRGELSAAVTVVDHEKVRVNVKVNSHQKPIDELLRKLKQ